MKACGWDGSKPSKKSPIIKDFPLAPLHGPVSSDLTEIWESQRRSSESQQSKSPPLYEKVIYLVDCSVMFLILINIIDS